MSRIRSLPSLKSLLENRSNEPRESPEHPDEIFADLSKAARQLFLASLPADIFRNRALAYKNIKFPPFFLEYSPYAGRPAPAPDQQWLEETEKGAYPAAKRDEDGDGYQEIERSSLNPLLGPFPLASYFDDRLYSIAASLVALHFLKTHNEQSLAGLKRLADARDFKAVNTYFRFLASGQDNPLQEIRSHLHAYLNLIAVHSGYGVGDGVNVEKNPFGFSVTGDGRWRVDCGIFAQLARSALRKIEGLSFSYIYMRGSDPDQAHVVLLVSDANDRHLLVDNASVLYFENSDPENFLIERFKAQGYDTLARGGSEWKPFAKHATFYPEP